MANNKKVDNSEFFAAIKNNPPKSKHWIETAHCIFVSDPEMYAEFKSTEKVIVVPYCKN